MTLFQHVLWGYEVTYPDAWVHQQVQDSDVFMPVGEGLDPNTPEPQTGQVVVRGEWNWARRPVEPLWAEHIGKLAGMLGAKNVGSAPWRIGDALGMEAEIVMPQKDNRRLWTGILAHDFRVLHFMVTHPREIRAQFEPEATRLIASLRFPDRVAGAELTPEGLPMPPGYAPADPQSIIKEIPEPQCWRAYSGSASAGALQAFYLRELPQHNWQMEEYIPFPGPSEIGFARFKLRRHGMQVILGIMPSAAATEGGAALANVVYKINE